MLRPSAFQNNGNSETASSSTKSILRPSSFQLAPSGLTSSSSSSSTTTTSSSSSAVTAAVATESNKNECDEPTTSSSGGDGASSSVSSTTNNDGENSGESSEDSKSATTTTTTTSNPFNSSKIKNADIDDEDDAEAKSKPNETTTSSTTTTTTQNSNKSDTEQPGSSLFASTNTKNLFAAAASKPIPILNGSESNFVFGQNIRERIVGVPDTSVASSSSSTIDDKDDDSSSASKLFAVSSASTLAESTSNNGHDTPKESSTVEDLTKVAREYEESRAQKRKLDAVETFTGEENEVNVLDMSCKLFAFIASNWEQRGPGSLRLNDVKTPSDTSDARSRVVFRTSGNFRVLINTKVWSGMVVEKPSQKSLRLTAIDPSDGAVKIFLIMARPDDVTSLQNALRKRIEAEKKREKTEGTATATAATATETAAAAEAEANSSTGNDSEPEAKKERKD